MEPDFLQAYRERYERASLSSPFSKRRDSQIKSIRKFIGRVYPTRNKMDPDFLQAYRKRYERVSLSSPFSKRPDSQIKSI